MTRDQDEFAPQLGRSRAPSAGARPLSFSRQVNRAIGLARTGSPRVGRSFKGRPGDREKTGRFNRRGRGAKIVQMLSSAGSWTLARKLDTRLHPRRVVVKARVVQLRGPRSGAAYSHLRYLRRDGVTLEGEPGRLYSAWEEESDGSQFLARGQTERHQFRVILAPEDGAEFGDL